MRDLATARAIAAHTPGFRLVTLQGELLEPDGTLTVGTHHAETGILSRKSELRELREQLARARIAASPRSSSDRPSLRDQSEKIETAAGAAGRDHVLGEQAADLPARVQRHQDRRQGLHEEVAVSRDEIQRIEQDVQALEAAWRDNESSGGAGRDAGAIAARPAASSRGGNPHARARTADRPASVHAGAGRVRPGRGAAARPANAIQSGGARLSAAAPGAASTIGTNVANLKVRLLESQRTMLNASSKLAHAYLDKEQLQQHVAELIEQRERKRLERAPPHAASPDRAHRMAHASGECPSARPGGDQFAPSARCPGATPARRLPDRNRRLAWPIAPFRVQER